MNISNNSQLNVRRRESVEIKNSFWMKKRGKVEGFLYIGIGLILKPNRNWKFKTIHFLFYFDCDQAIVRSSKGIRIFLELTYNLILFHNIVFYFPWLKFRVNYKNIS